MLPAGHERRAVVADDDAFLAALVSELLTREGFIVHVATDPESAWAIACAVTPDVVVSDLDFGETWTGIDLLQRVRERFPRAGLVLLTSHQDPQFVVGLEVRLPVGTVYQVKSALRSADVLLSTVRAAVGEGPLPRFSNAPAIRTFRVTAPQAEVLRLMANGASTKAIAAHRGTSVRATELLLKRLYEALEIAVNGNVDPRVPAVRLWKEGAVRLDG